MPEETPNPFEQFNNPLFSQPKDISEIKDESVSLQGITPDIPETGMITNVGNIREFNDNVQKVDKLRQKITEVQGELAEKQKQLAEKQKQEQADFEAKQDQEKQLALERQAVGVIEEIEDPRLVEWQKEKENYEKQLNDALVELDSLRINDVAQQQLINAIKMQFDVRRTQAEQAGQRALQAAQTFNMRFGSSRFNPLAATGVIQAQEQATLRNLAEIDAMEAQALAEINQAEQEKDFILLREKIALVDEQRKEKNNQLIALQNQVNEENRLRTESLQQMERHSRVFDFIRNGITNVADIFQLAGDIPLEEVEYVIDTLVEEQEQKPTESKIDAYTDENNHRVITFYDSSTGFTREVVSDRQVLQKSPESDPQQILTNTRNLKKDFSASPEVKDFVQVREKFQKLEEAKKEAEITDNFVVVDQAFITLFNKITDPNSVVRESEYARTSTDIGFINRIKGKAEKVIAGGAGLTQDERDAILRLVGRFMNVSARNFNNKRQEFVDIANAFGLDATLIVGQPASIKEDITPQANEIKVRELSSGLIGFLPENEFDPSLYTKVE